MALEGIDGFMEEPLLGLPDFPIRKQVAETIRQDFPSGVNRKSTLALSGFD
jgi:hypothetical protein